MIHWVSSPDELRAATARLAASRELALDSESDGLHHHLDKVCLLQIASEDGSVFLIDTLAVRDLTPLAPLLADPARPKVLHGADYDVTTLKRDFGFAFAGLFDTMIAARLLGRRELGLQALAAQELGVTLSKDNQRDDWSRRPLSAAQERYAAADVQHLLELKRRLGSALAERGRLAWQAEECAAVAALEPALRRSDPEAWLKVKGAARLSRRALAVLRELYGWREALAVQTDVPAFRLLSTEPLLALAERPPLGPEELAQRRGLAPLARRHGAGLLEAVARAMALEESALPSFPRSPRPQLSEAVKRRGAALRAWRDREAGRLELDIAVVLPQRLLEKVAADPPTRPDDLERVPGFRRWRAQAFGPALVELLARS